MKPGDSGAHDIREAAMRWLDQRPNERVAYDWLATFEYDGRRVPLMDRQRGIRKPAGMDAALAIRTTYTPPNQRPPYDDDIGSDGLQRYKYRGMCKIHHAAFDRNFLGISPDLRVDINRRLLEEVDGPMLRHGLQEMHGSTILVPSRRSERPDEDRLATRYEQFRAAGRSSGTAGRGRSLAPTRWSLGVTQ